MDLPMNAPLISVLMSVHNGGAFLSKAIGSILHQTLKDFEFIIIDDGSTDDTWAVVSAAADRDRRIRPVKNEANIGLTASLNRGLDLASGRYIARQDADDVSLPNRFQEQVRRLEANLSLVLVGSAYEVIDAQGDIVGIESYPERDIAIRWRMLFDNAFAHSSIVLRRSVLVSNKLHYDEECRFAQDYELWSRLLRHGQGENIPVPLIRYRVHDRSVGGRFGASQQDTACRIALANMRGLLGCVVSLADVRIMREWERTESVVADGDFPRVYGLLLALIERFSHDHADERRELRVMRSRWMIRGLAGFPLSRLCTGTYWRLFGRTMGLEPAGLMEAIAGYVWKRIIPAHSSFCKE